MRAKKSGTKSGTGALAGLDSTREWPENRVAVMAGPGLGSQPAPPCHNQGKNREVEMFRSVTETARRPISQRIIHWVGGVFVAIGIISVLILGFGALMAPGS